MKFKPEIEGMRAVAVVAVVLFHTGFLFIPGGFLGVDIFFVISGFLITSNILNDIHGGEFSFREFYRRRVLRLFPAAATTALVTLAVSFVVLPPDEVLNLAKSALAALFAVSNFYFWSQVGYFDIDAHLKPLLHTWSLGVEEQFYLLWPALLLLCLRIGGKRAILWGVASAGIVSLIGASLMLRTDPGAAFYLMPFRIFEFAIGILLAAAGVSRRPGPLWSGIIGSTGLLAILVSVVVFSASWPMPSVYSLLPCLGAAAIIYGGNTRPIATLLSNPAMLFVGRISYSLYLVHWPIVTFAGHAALESLPGKLGILVLCFLAAVLQFYCIEKPLRRRKRGAGFIGTRAAAAGCAVAMLLASTAAVYALATDGLRFRLPPELRAIPTAWQMWQERNPTVRVSQCFVVGSQTFAAFDKGSCLRVKPGAKNYLVLGDSVAADLYSVLSQAYPKVTFLEATSGNCRPIPGNERDKNCVDLLKYILDDFIPNNHSIDGVILAGNWSYDDLNKLDKVVAPLRRRVGRVIVAGAPTRFSDAVPTLIFDSRGINTAEVESFVYARRFPGDTVNAILAKKYAAVIPFIDLQAAMCREGCHLFTASGKMIFVDAVHLTAAGATYLSKYIRQAYPNLF